MNLLGSYRQVLRQEINTVLLDAPTIEIRLKKFHSIQFLSESSSIRRREIFNHIHSETLPRWALLPQFQSQCLGLILQHFPLDVEEHVFLKSVFSHLISETLEDFNAQQLGRCFLRVDLDFTWVDMFGQEVPSFDRDLYREEDQLGLGLSKSEMKKLLKPMRTDLVENDVDCSICLEKLSSRKHIVLIPSCSHAFHRRCILRWLEQKTSCPLCRSEVV